MFQPQRPTNGAAKKKKIRPFLGPETFSSWRLFLKFLTRFSVKKFLKNLKIIELREFIALKFNA